MDRKISVIVPVYNAERTLKRCVDSILLQSFNNFELLLVNDGSDDASAFICNEYAKIDSRVKVFHQENVGVSSARNLGIDNAKGEWIAFVDSDDTVELDWLNSYISVLNESNDNILYVQNVTAHNTRGETALTYTDKCPSSLLQLYGSVLWGAVWNKLFYTAIIKDNHIRFDKELKFSEDCLFVANYCSFVSQLVYIHAAGYNFYCPDSYKQKYSDHAGFDKQLALYKKIKHVNLECSNRLVDGLIMDFLDSSCNKETLTNRIEECRSIVGKQIKHVKGLRKMPFRVLSYFNSSLLWNLLLSFAVKHKNIWLE